MYKKERRLLMLFILCSLFFGGFIALSLYLETRKKDLLVIGIIAILLAIVFTISYLKWEKLNENRTNRVLIHKKQNIAIS